MSVLLLCLFTFLPLGAQSAKEVLDKAAAVVSAKSGCQASFTIKSDYMDTSGSIAIKDKKFHATTSQAVVWFDGKTQWTYVKKNDEVNVSNPTESQIQAINPYHFIYMYKQGYKYTMEKKNGSYVVHLTATDQKKPVREAYLTLSQKTYAPTQIRMKQQKGWTTIGITAFKQAKLSDSLFRFNAKEFPTAEVIDLR